MPSAPNSHAAAGTEQLIPADPSENTCGATGLGSGGTTSATHVGPSDHMRRVIEGSVSYRLRISSGPRTATWRTSGTRCGKRVEQTRAPVPAVWGRATGVVRRVGRYGRAGGCLRWLRSRPMLSLLRPWWWSSVVHEVGWRADVVSRRSEDLRVCRLLDGVRA